MKQDVRIGGGPHTGSELPHYTSPETVGPGHHFLKSDAISGFFADWRLLHSASTNAGTGSMQVERDNSEAIHARRRTSP
ncbi:hypothetical protein IX51_01225 [uncultured archaeon]|nr:hypothetical protein IX51_01225 [uncultured archaeon]HKJ96693.1 hypothetical protein [Thermoplasmataceae archaeon]